MSEGVDRWAEAAARARRLGVDASALREDMAALRGERRQRRRRAAIAEVERMIERVSRELSALDPTIEEWDGVQPPPEHLFERVETVEARLSEIEKRLRALAGRHRASSVGDPVLIRCAWCRRFKIGDMWMHADAEGEREQQIADRLGSTCSHGICPTCLEKVTRGHPR
jgi:hypothetical protein